MTLFDKLLGYFRNKLDTRILWDADPLIRDIKLKNERAETLIYIELTDDMKENCISLSDDDIWFMNSLNSERWGPYDFMTMDSLDDEITQGYSGVFQDMDSNNLIKLKDITKIVLPNQNFDISDVNFKKTMYEKLILLFPSEINSIIYAYQTEINSAASDNANEKIEEEMNRYLSQFNMRFTRNYNRIVSSVGNLIYLYRYFNSMDKDLEALLCKAFKNNQDVGGWFDDLYQFMTGEIDETSYNRVVERELDSIYEKVYDDTNIRENLKFLNDVTKKFKWRIWYQLPKNPEIVFRLIGFSFENRKIEIDVRYSKANKKPMRIKFSEENFYNFLYHPELFDGY